MRTIDIEGFYGCGKLFRISLPSSLQSIGQYKDERERGPELMERVAKVFVEQLLASEPGQILRLGEAYEVFRKILKQKELPDIKRSDFKAVVGPMITSNFKVALRNDLPGHDGAGVRGWKGVRLVQALPP